METPNKLSEENRLIADFMDLKKFGFRNENYLVLERHLSPIQLPYKTSWEWLMPVIKKIDSYASEELSYSKFDDYRTNWAMIDRPSKYPIERVYEQIVQFIEWYNKQ
jgi:hypothetical protein